MAVGRRIGYIYPIRRQSNIEAIGCQCPIALRENLMFTQTVEYALRIVVHLADKSPESRTTVEIAEATRIPKAYLSKVIQGLVRASIIQSNRGYGGGVKLLKAPKDLTILDVVNAVEPIKRIQFCPLRLKSHGIDLCPLHKRMDNALASVEDALRHTTLAEVLSEPTNSHPLCETADCIPKSLRPGRHSKP